MEVFNLKFDGVRSPAKSASYFSFIVGGREVQCEGTYVEDAAWRDEDDSCSRSIIVGSPINVHLPDVPVKEVPSLHFLSLSREVVR